MFSMASLIHFIVTINSDVAPFSLIHTHAQPQTLSGPSIEIGQCVECNLFSYNLLIDPVFNNTNNSQSQAIERESLRINKNAVYFRFEPSLNGIHLTVFFLLDQTDERSLRFYCSHLRWSILDTFGWLLQMSAELSWEGAYAAIHVWLFVYYYAQPIHLRQQFVIEQNPNGLCVNHWPMPFKIFKTVLAKCCESLAK